MVLKSPGLLPRLTMSDANSGKVLGQADKSRPTREMRTHTKTDFW